MFARRSLRTFTALPPMSGNVRFCPVFSTLSRFSPSTPCTNRTYSNFRPAPDRTYQTSAPQPDFLRVRLRALRARLVCLAPKVSVFSAFYPNVRKCPVLSGLSKAIPVVTINILSQQDLHQFPSCSQPDIRLAAGVFRFRTPLFCRELAAPSSVAPAPALATPRVVQAYHCWYSGMWV